jgi:hypothetical protein
MRDRLVTRRAALDALMCISLAERCGCGSGSGGCGGGGCGCDCGGEGKGAAGGPGPGVRTPMRCVTGW